MAPAGYPLPSAPEMQPRGCGVSPPTSPNAANASTLELVRPCAPGGRAKTANRCASKCPFLIDIVLHLRRGGWFNLIVY